MRFLNIIVKLPTTIVIITLALFCLRCARINKVTRRGLFLEAFDMFLVMLAAHHPSRRRGTAAVAV